MSVNPLSEVVRDENLTWAQLPSGAGPEGGVRLAIWLPTPAGSAVKHCQILTLSFTLWAGEKAAGVMGTGLVAVPQQTLALEKHKDRVVAETSSLSSGKAME